MAKKFIAEKTAKKKSATSASWLLWLFLLVFIAIVLRFALRLGPQLSSAKGTMPTGQDAFEVAKQFVRPTIGSMNADFADGEFEYSKNNDSVYIVKSYYETRPEGGEKVKTGFVITLKFNGGKNSSKQNWTVMNLEQQ